MHLEFDDNRIDANEIGIYDLTGRKVFSQRIPDMSQSDVSLLLDLTSGAYILRIGSTSRLIIRK